VAEGLMGAYTQPPFYAELSEAQQAVISAPRYRHEFPKNREVLDLLAARQAGPSPG